MKIRLRTAVAIGAAAVLATGLVTSTAVAATLGNPGGDKPPISSLSASETQTAAAASQPYGAGSMLVYVPITPCRVVDTRVGGGKIAANATREFYVGGSTGFPGQGGRSGGCDIPTTAAAVATALTSTQPSGVGRVILYPSAEPTPLSTMLSYGIGNHTSTPTVSLTPGTQRQMEVRNYAASVHLVIDVIGYYVPQYSAYVNEDGTLWLSGGGLSSGRLETGVYEVEFDTDISYCNGVGSASAAGYTVSVFPWEGVATVEITDPDGALVDSAFNLVIVC